MKFFNSTYLFMGFEAANIVAGSVALYDFLTNPEADNAFTQFDVAVHYLSAIAFYNRDKEWVPFANTFFNLLFCMAIADKMGSEDEHTYPPFIVLIVDYGFHLANILLGALATHNNLNCDDNTKEDFRVGTEINCS